MIELVDVTKSYPTPLGRRYVFRDLSFRFPDDVNIGLIGPNGAGKSTLMRLLGGIDSPDRGRVRSDKRISWPVGLGGGFQPSLTGRDNVRFVSRVYGATGQAMRRVIEFVESFAEIGDYFDQPVKMYSSGMRSRLAFGMSMAFEFDYYLIDEVMAVGDARFRGKCQTLFSERLKRSHLILVSHSMRDIVQFCDVVVLIEGGTARVFEDVKEGVAAYQGDASATDASAASDTPIEFPPHVQTKRQALRYIHWLKSRPDPAAASPTGTAVDPQAVVETATASTPAPSSTPAIVFPPHVRNRTQAIRYIGYLAAERESQPESPEGVADVTETPKPERIVFPPYVKTRTQALRYLGYLAAEAENERPGVQPVAPNGQPADTQVMSTPAVAPTPTP